MSIFLSSGIIIEFPPPPRLSGTIFDNLTEIGIVSGGKTILITLFAELFIAAGVAFDAQRQALIDRFVSAGSETFGWNNVRSGIPVTAVARTGDRLVTITLPPLVTYDITVKESITGGVHSAIMLAADGDLVATPIIDVDPVSAGESITWPGGAAIQWPEGGDVTWP